MSGVTTTEIRGRGEITIPKKIRDSLNLEVGQKLELIPIGDETFLLTPQRFELEEARRQIQRILKQTGCDPKQVLNGLKEGREETFQKHYGRRVHGRKD